MSQVAWPLADHMCTAHHAEVILPTTSRCLSWISSLKYQVAYLSIGVDWNLLYYWDIGAVKWPTWLIQVPKNPDTRKIGQEVGIPLLSYVPEGKAPQNSTLLRRSKRDLHSVLVLINEKTTPKSEARCTMTQFARKYILREASWTQEQQAPRYSATNTIES